jgi:hypothetical protein
MMLTMIADAKYISRPARRAYMLKYFRGVYGASTVKTAFNRVRGLETNLGTKFNTLEFEHHMRANIVDLQENGKKPQHRPAGMRIR